MLEGNTVASLYPTLISYQNRRTLGESRSNKVTMNSEYMPELSIQGRSIIHNSGSQNSTPPTPVASWDA